MSADYAYAYGRAKTLARFVLDDLESGSLLDVEWYRAQLRDIDWDLHGDTQTSPAALSAGSADVAASETGPVRVEPSELSTHPPRPVAVGQRVSS